MATISDLERRAGIADRETHVPRDRSMIERVADATAPYVLVAAIAALGALGMVCAVQLERYERQLVAEARI
ncbi:hypothetical protein [Shinella sp. BYT-45]|uniref:hypothetical protein n=1 Tax=Shinella sp. BYT-45 TaxID=3377377 RepID=UPI0039810781